MEMGWWKQSVVYQIYPRSFQDSNGDGIGDLKGIIRRLPYLSELGIDVIWLSPVYQSPQDDNGYDISDYQAIDPMFGTMEDMEELIQKAGRHGIKIVMDLVLNHTSDEHPWFLEAKKGRDNPYHDYYVWRDGEPDTPPNALQSCFGGSAWEWSPESGQYYLHQFSVRQPDLNWDDPAVRTKLYRMIRWWMDKGIAGFRLDVVDKIAKEPDRLILDNGSMLHSYIREMSRETFQKENCLSVGEAWSATPETAMQYSNPDGSELSMVFQFEHMCLDEHPGKSKWDLAPLNFLAFKRVLAKWQTKLYGKGWNSLFWNNHDLPRIVSRFGDDGKYRVESATMLATALHGMQGTPYIYQGEEIGMTNVRYPIDDYRDIELLNFYRERIRAGEPEETVMASIYAKGRDNARTPMQWDTSAHAGFTSGTPWIRVNPNYTSINVEQDRNHPCSIFRYYQKLIRLRRESDVIQNGSFRLLLEEHDRIFAYIREWNDKRLLILCNFYGSQTEIPQEIQNLDGQDVVLGNYADMQAGRLRPYEARICRI